MTAADQALIVQHVERRLAPHLDALDALHRLSPPELHLLAKLERDALLSNPNRRNR